MNDLRPQRLDPGLWLDEALQLVTLRLEHEVALTRLLRGEDRQEGFLGLFVSDAEAQAIIGELAGTRSVAGATQNETRIATLWQRVAADRVADHRGIWARYASAFGLSEAELDLILLAAAPALDPRFARVYGYLNDDLARRHLTPALARTLLDRHALSVRDIRAMLAPDGPLLAYGILEAAATSPFNDTPLRLNESALAELMGDAPAGAGGIPVARVGTPDDNHAPRIALAAARPNDPAFWASQAAAARGLRLSRHDLRGLAAATDFRAALLDLFRQCALDRCLPLFHGADALAAPEAQTFARAAAAHQFCLATDTPDLWARRGLVCVAAGGPPPPIGERLAAIAPLIASHPADLVAMQTRLRQSGKLGLGPVIDILTRFTRDDDITAGVARALQGDLDGLARRIETPFTRDDLVVPRATRRALDALISWRHHAGEVLTDWGLGATFGKTRAMTALFKGPSGTGKTMAASVIANTLGLPLYKVDLATLVSKYIGETERNLDKLFTAAEAADVVLFFDECDAIFGKRGEVNDAHDRYANLETSYLLQRMEAFDGIMILASNLHQNMDEAFLRRIDLVTEFPAPGARERRALWQRLDRTRTPLAGDVDFAFLADTFDLTGGEIRNCCLDAAHHAAASGRQVDMALLAQAVARELVKQGRTLHHSSFGPYQHHLAPGRGS